MTIAQISALWQAEIDQNKPRAPMRSLSMAEWAQRVVAN